MREYLEEIRSRPKKKQPGRGLPAMLAAALLVIGCGPVPRFREQPVCIQALGDSGRIISFDMDKDGQEDYWHRFDSAARKIELRLH